MDGLDFKKPKSHVQWSTQSQTFLCCLFRFFRKDKDAFRRVFASLFADDLKNFNNHELPFSTLSTQWADMRRHGDPVWYETHVATPFPATGLRLTVLECIKDTAARIDVSLVEKEKDDINISSFRLNPRRHRNRADPTTSLETPVSTSPFSSQSLPSSQSSQLVQSPHVFQPQSTAASRPESLCTAGEKVCYWCYHDGTSSDEVQTSPEDGDVPPLLYRWSNVDSQGANTRTLMLSGLFSNTEQGFFFPEEVSQVDFERYVESHVSITKVVSPFISTFQSLLAPVHRSLRAREGATVNIIDPSKLDRHVYSAKKLVRDLGIEIRGYRGFGEYLVWGRIPTPAIICSFTITSLVRIAEEDREIGRVLQLDRIVTAQRNQKKLQRSLSLGPGKLDWGSGRVVGRLLRKLNVPGAHIEQIALGISRSWRFSRVGREDDYLQGAREGYLSTTSPTITVLSRAEIPASMSPRTPLTNLKSAMAERELARPVQNEPYSSTEEDSDVAMSEEDIEDEDKGDDHIFPSIESPCPPARHHPTVPLPGTECPSVEYFDPVNQQWTENTPEVPVTDWQDALHPPYRQEINRATPVTLIETDSDNEPESSVIMRDGDLEVFMEEFVNLD